jgi:hypothetical protein
LPSPHAPSTDRILVVEVMDACRSAGIERIGVVTTRERQAGHSDASPR